MGVLDITQTVRERRRCVPAALVGYIVAGCLGALPVGALLAVLSGRTEILGLAILALPILALAVAVAIASKSAELANFWGAVVENVFVVLFMGAVLYVFHQASMGVLLALGAASAAAIWFTLSGLVAALRYGRTAPAAVRAGGRLRRRLHEATVLRSSKAFLAVIHFLAAVACFILPMALGVAYIERGLSDSSFPPPGWKTFALFFVLLIVCFELGNYLFGRAKRLRQIEASAARKLDSRRPVLLLRSFKDDLIRVQRRLDVRSYRVGHVADLALTLEEVLERVLGTYGPVIAIGRPGEALPPAGAAREYVSNAEWRTRVAELVGESERVVVIVGKSEGLALEYEDLRSLQAWSKVILIFPPIEFSELLQRWEALGRAIGLQSGEPGSLPPAGALAAGVAREGQPQFVTCQWRDDECYELALRWIMAKGDAA
jgi:hypothetical protein